MTRRICPTQPPVAPLFLSLVLSRMPLLLLLLLRQLSLLLQLPFPIVAGCRFSLLSIFFSVFLPIFCRV